MSKTFSRCVGMRWSAGGHGEATADQWSSCDRSCSDLYSTCSLSTSSTPWSTLVNCHIYTVDVAPTWIHHLIHAGYSAVGIGGFTPDMQLWILVINRVCGCEREQYTATYVKAKRPHTQGDIERK